VAEEDTGMTSSSAPVRGRTMGSRASGLAGRLARGTAAALLVVTTSGCAYDELAAHQERIAAAWASVEREIDRRAALLGDLMPVVRANVARDTAVLNAAADARARMLAATARADRMEAASGLAESASRLLALGDTYPALRADPRFQTLAQEVAETNRRLAAEEQRFNAAVRAYNGTLEAFPTRLYAKFLGFEPAAYLDAGTVATESRHAAAAPST
jgi:LemA protein